MRNVFLYQSKAEPLSSYALDWLMQPVVPPIAAVGRNESLVGVILVQIRYTIPTDWNISQSIPVVLPQQLNSGTFSSMIEPEAYAIPITSIGYWFMPVSNKPHFQQVENKSHFRQTNNKPHFLVSKD